MIGLPLTVEEFTRIYHNMDIHVYVSTYGYVVDDGLAVEEFKLSHQHMDIYTK